MSAAAADWSTSPVWRRARLRRAARSALPLLLLGVAAAALAVAGVESRAEATLLAVGTHTQLGQHQGDGEATFVAAPSPAAAEAVDQTLAEAQAVEGRLPWGIGLAALSLGALWVGRVRPERGGARPAQALAVR